MMACAYLLLLLLVAFCLERLLLWNFDCRQYYFVACFDGLLHLLLLLVQGIGASAASAASACLERCCCCSSIQSEKQQQRS
jgi:hypothetical protein